MSLVDPRALVPANEVEGDDAEETALLRRMLADARRYLLEQRWCRSIREVYYGTGVGGIVAAFLVRIDALEQVDEWLWVVVGDLPPAYIVTDQIDRPVDALVVYCDLMEDWVRAVLGGGSLSDVFPVDAPADFAHAKKLGTRIRTLRKEIIPALS